MKNWDMLVIGASVVVASAILAVGLCNSRQQIRTVSVRGLCEKNVDADLAIWPLTFTLGSNNLDDLQADVGQKVATVAAYLEEHGLDAADYAVLSPNITNVNLNSYTDKKNVVYSYTARQVIYVRSGKVQKVKEAQAGALDLVSKGIIIENDYGSKLSFDFVSLLDIKPQMIKDATIDARAAAEQFARDSGSKVGKIKSATQGLFSIENLAEGLDDIKRVRVVTQVEYELK